MATLLGSFGGGTTGLPKTNVYSDGSTKVVSSSTSTAPKTTSTTAPKTTSTKTSSTKTSSTSTKPLAQMTVAEAAAAGKTAEYNALVAGYGVTAPSTTSTTKPLTYAPGSLETMTVDQAAKAGRTSEYNAMVNQYLAPSGITYNGPGSTPTVTATGAAYKPNYSTLASTTNIANAGVQPISIPTAPVTDITGTGIAAGIAASPLQPTQPTQPIQPTTPTTYDKFIESLGVSETPAPEKTNTVDIEKQAGIPAIQARVNDLKAKIDMETAQTTANLLKARESASTEGGTEAIFGGRQAQIERESAIRLLPLTAMYQAELGNLTTAKEMVSTFIADENAYQDRLYAWRKDIRDNAIQYGTAQQNRQFELQDKADALAVDAYKTNNASRENWANTAFDAGNSVTAGAILKLDPASPDFNNKLAQLTSNLATNTPKNAPEAGKALSLAQVEQFRRSYGWTPPLNFTMEQLEKYVADNPNATPAELEAGARQASNVANTEITNNVTTTPQTVDSVIEGIRSRMTADQIQKLKDKADEAGVSKWYKYKTFDIKNYLYSISDQIQTAIDSGYSTDDILGYLTQ